MLKYIKLYLKYQGYNIAAQLQYRFNFIIFMLTVFAQPLTMILSFFIITEKFGTLGGWTFWQMSLIYGIWRLSHSISISFFQQAWNIGYYVRSGTFDSFLIKPLNPLYQLFCIQFQKIGIPHFISGVVIVSVSMTKLALSISAIDILYLFIAVIAGAVIEMFMTLLMSSFSFWFINSRNLLDITLRIDYTLMQYPINIYNKAIKGLLTYIFPFAFMSFYPAQYFITNGDVISPVFIYGGPIVAGIVASLAILVFYKGIDHYESTGN